MNWTQEFEVKDEHVKLLSRAIVSWEDCEFGAPSIDCKRPYGNSSVYQDIAEILGIQGTENKYEEIEFSDEQREQMRKFHKETETALQIFLATGEMKAGRYTADKYGTNWKPVSD